LQPTYTPTKSPTVQPTDPSPTTHPSVVPTQRPTAAPSQPSLGMVLTSTFGDNGWFPGAKEHIYVNLVGDGRQNKHYVDVYIYDSDDPTLTPIVVLASGAEFKTQLKLAYNVPNLEIFGAAASRLQIRAVEYTLGYDARSPLILVSASYYPTAQPSPMPTTFKPSPAPSQVPTTSPTASTMSVEILDSSAGVAAAPFVVVNETSLDFHLHYTGSLSHDLPGFATLRVCDGSSKVVPDYDLSTGYNGPSSESPYTTCAVLATLTYATPLVNGALALSGFKILESWDTSEIYFRVDSMADRNALGDWGNQWSAYALAYTSPLYTLTDFAPTSAPTYHPTTSHPTTIAPTYHPTLSPTATLSPTTELSVAASNVTNATSAP